MSDKFETNYSLLKKRFPSLLPLIENKISDKFEVITARSGAVTARYKETLLHSRFDPKKEAAQFAQSANLRPGDHLLIYGLGLGFHLKPILDIIGPSGRLIVIELNRDVLSAAFSLMDLSGILSHPNFNIVAGETDKEVSGNLNRVFSEEWGKRSGEKSKTLVHPPSFKFIPANFSKIQITFEMQLVEERTKAVWGKRERHNYSINREHVAKGKGIKELRGKYNGKPAFLISAGPSLDRTLPYLARLSESFHIIAVDSALSVLLKAGVRPNYFLSVDPQDISFNHISNHLDETVPVILTPTSNPNTVRYYRGEKHFVVQRASDIDESEIETLIEEKGESKAGGSVSCLTMDIMVQMGFNPIILVGQDCGFPGNRVYAENAYEDNTFIDLLWQYNTLDLISSEKIKGKKKITIENKFGEKIYSHEQLYIYLRYLEQIVKNYGEVKFYNWLSMGAKVEGITDIESIAEIPAFSGIRIRINAVLRA